MKKIIATAFCIAAFLGLLDAIVSLSNHLAEKTVNAGELDVQSVQEATEIFVNEKGIFETITKNKIEASKNGHTQKETLDPFTPVVLAVNDPFTPFVVTNNEDCKCCSCSKGCKCKCNCKCKQNKKKCCASCDCYVPPKGAAAATATAAAKIRSSCSGSKVNYYYQNCTGRYNNTYRWNRW